MKRIFLNLKRFDIPNSSGGVNQLAEPKDWAQTIIERTGSGLEKYRGRAEFGMYFPELYLYPAIMTAGDDFPAQIGAQSVFRNDVSKNGNFGAFTSNRTAKSIAGLGAKSVMIGHCEERKDKLETMQMGWLKATGEPEVPVEVTEKFELAVNEILCEEIQCAQRAGLSVLYCLGEKDFQVSEWENVLTQQVTLGLKGIDLNTVTIAYEPVWAIGPNKVPPQAEYITKIARFLKRLNPEVSIVYGGGLKKENAAMLASIPEIDGGLIALTSFIDPIGFYPDQYLEIIDIYMSNLKE